MAESVAMPARVGTSLAMATGSVALPGAGPGGRVVGTDVWDIARFAVLDERVQEAARVPQLI